MICLVRVEFRCWMAEMLVLLVIVYDIGMTLTGGLVGLGFGVTSLSASGENWQG